MDLSSSNLCRVLWTEPREIIAMKAFEAPIKTVVRLIYESESESDPAAEAIDAAPQVINRSDRCGIKNDRISDGRKIRLDGVCQT